MCRIPQDIDTESPTKNSQSGGQTLIANKPLTLDATKMTPHASEALSPSERQCSLSPTPTPNPMTETTPGPSVADTAHRSDPAESLKVHLGPHVGFGGWMTNN
jgi:hypothetical protein